MRKHGSDVCKLRPCLNKESKNSARLCTIVTAALQWQYSQTELIFWISLVYPAMMSTQNYMQNKQGSIPN